LVGCGRIAGRHTEILGSGVINEARLVSVCDIVESKAQALGRKYNVSFYTDPITMLDSELGIDLIVILTESGLHAQLVIDLCKYKKHIMVEKPIALTLSDGEAMVDACRQAGVKLFVVKQNRLNVPVVKLYQAIEQGRFGRIHTASVRVRWCRDHNYYDQASWRGTYELDGGVIANQASHHVDLLSSILGPAQSVFAVGKRALSNIEAEDTCLAIVRFKNDALGLIEATTATRPVDLEGSISVLGERGTAVIGGFAVNQLLTWNFADGLDNIDEVKDNFSVNPPNVYGYGHQEYYSRVVKYLHGELTNPPISDHEALQTLELICGIYESMHLEQEVHFPVSSYQNKLGR